MTINEFLAIIAQVSGLLGIVASMLGMGLGLTLAQITQPLKNAWKKWGPYLSERQWGTVREDYSENGDAWNYFP
jgi:hypothetical protein